MLVANKWKWIALTLGVAVMAFAAVGVFSTNGQAAAEPDPAKGKVVFDNSCALCHGAGGVGKVGPTIAGAAGHVKNLAMPPEAIVGLLRGGINGRMPSFPPEILSDDDIMNLGAYLFSLPPATGEQLFENPSQCAACHGPKGIGGVGPRLAGMGPIVAAQMGLTKEQLLGGMIPLLHNGIPGKMPAFKHLTDGEILSIGEYIWNLPAPTWEQEFTALHGRAPTGEDMLDKDWGDRFLRSNGRMPTQAEWEKHFMDRKGFNK